VNKEIYANKCKQTKMANSTIKTQEKIIGSLIEMNQPISITALADKTNSSIYSVKATIQFLQKLGVVQTITSSGKTTFVIFVNKKEGENGIVTN
jgi:predicted transcriptional regulator